MKLSESSLDAVKSALCILACFSHHATTLSLYSLVAEISNCNLDSITAGIYVGRNGHLIIDGCVFKDNIWGVFADSGSVVEIRNCSFESNLYWGVFGQGDDTRISIIDSKFESCGVFVNDGVELSVSKSTFQNAHRGILVGKNCFGNLKSCEFGSCHYGICVGVQGDKNLKVEDSKFKDCSEAGIYSVWSPNLAIGPLCTFENSETL